MSGTGQHYKVKLASGRVLGPLDLERVRLLILKNQIVGTETAREYPTGDWQDINQIPKIAELLVAHAEGRLAASSGGESATHSTHVLPGATEVLAGTVRLQTNSGISKASQPSLELQEPLPTKIEQPLEPKSESVTLEPHESDKSNDSEAERTRATSTAIDNPKARAKKTKEPTKSQPVRVERPRDLPAADAPKSRASIAEAPTVMFERSRAPESPAQETSLPGKRTTRKKELLRAVFGIIAVIGLAMEFFGGEPKTQPLKITAIRPELPVFFEKSDPEKSSKSYTAAMTSYVDDTVQGYKNAANKLREAAGLDGGNVKALAMLASSYLNLIDSSNKDENYFTVISKLIEMSRAKNVDLPETVIADVEFYITINKAEAAQNRIVEYTKTHQNFGLEMFYYLALAFYHRGDAASAARYLAQFPDNKAFSAKIFYLRGQVAEMLQDNVSAMKEYEKAVQFNKGHAKSRLRIAQLLYKQGKLRDAGAHLNFISKNPELLPPKDLALGYYLHSQYSALSEKWDVALGDMERAVALDKENHDFLLEFYTLRAKAGDKISKLKADARMYYFMSEGERLIRLNKYQEALTQFLLARQANDKSPLPPIKIGDMFARMGDLGNARVNYKLAAERAPNNIQVWSKYIDVLIQMYEWVDAESAMDKFRKLPVPQSAIDKAAADMYAKQGRHSDAQGYYRKAMGRDVIDPDVYIAYAKSLMATKNFKEAPFFFALALRFDPLNTDAVIGTAKCVAETESVERAISMLQDELQKSSASRSELLSAIAEFQIQKGDWQQALVNIEQAKAANPDYGYPWKLEAQIHLSRERDERGALDKALRAFQSYSERNASDPSGYMERYRIFIKKTEYEKAGDELQKVYVIYPKYPNLHYYKGALYAVMGNHKVAIEEFQRELANNSNNVPAMIALGRSLEVLGSVQDALQHFNKAMQLQPQSAEAKHEAGWANFLLKNYPGAIALFQAALIYDKANPLLYKRLGLAFQSAGDHGNAAEAFRKYLQMEPDAPDRAQFERYR